MKVRYIPLSDRIQPYFAVCLVGPRREVLVGYVSTLSTGRWIARGRSDPARCAVAGWLRRSDGARWLLIAGGFARDPEAWTAVAAA